MAEAIKKLVETLGKDQVLADKFKACKTLEEQVKLANELGFEVAAEDFSCLSDDQLDQVAGGAIPCLVYTTCGEHKQFPF